MCENGPFNGNRGAAAYVAPDYRRLHATGAVALHPGILREHKAVNLGTEIFYHVVAFKFTVYNHVEADFFLQLDAFSNLLAVEFYVLFACDFAFAERGAVGADFGGLRERTDCRCWESGQVESVLLHFATFETARLAFEISVREGGELALHGAVLLDASCREQGLVLFECGFIAACEFCKFRELFFGKCKVVERFCWEFCFGIDGVGHMQQ